MPPNVVIGKRFYRFISKFYYFLSKCVFEVEQIRGVINGIGIWPCFGLFLLKSWPFLKNESGSPVL